MSFHLSRKPSVLCKVHILEWYVGCGVKEGLCGVSWGTVLVLRITLLSHLGSEAEHAAGKVRSGVRRGGQVVSRKCEVCVLQDDALFTAILINCVAVGARRPRKANYQGRKRFGDVTFQLI